MPTDDLLFGIAIHDQSGNHLYGTNTRILGVDVPAAAGDGEMTFEFDRVPLLDGTYLVTLAIQTTDEGVVYDWREQQHHFEVMNPSRTPGTVSFPVQVHFGNPAMEPAE
jgi:lipopolysaccharide transport system ATP-binding protein